MYDYELKTNVEKKFSKLVKKDKFLLLLINKKIDYICRDPFHSYKFLRKPMQNFNRVHIMDHFVLVFFIDHSKKLITFCNFDHHDNIYCSK